MKHDFPRVSRARLKVIDTESPDIGDGSTATPTEEEKAWIDIMKATDPEREKTRRKISVCSFAEVVEYNKESVSILYDNIKYTIRKPVNGLRIARAREVSAIDALEELNAQRQIVIGAVPLAKNFDGVDAEIIQLLARVADNFFFTAYV